MTPANAMRDLALGDRNALIAEAGDKVLDLRPILADRMTKRLVAEGYRKGLVVTKGPAPNG